MARPDAKRRKKGWTGPCKGFSRVQTSGNLHRSMEKLDAWTKRGRKTVFKEKIRQILPGTIDLNILYNIKILYSLILM